MLVVSDSIKNAYNKYTTQRKSYIKVGDNSFFVQNLDIQADCYEDGNVIGNAIAKIAKFDIETEKVKGLDEFELFDGIWTGNQYEYISLGTFKLLDEKGTDDFFSLITAYDKMINFNKSYLPSLITFPISLYDFLVSICEQANVFLENSTIPNGEQILTSNPFVEGETLKQILKAICQINGCFGMISSDRLKLLLKGNDTLNLQKFQVSKPEYKRTTWKINQVVLGMSNVEGEYVLRQDKDDIAKNGVHKLVINDNPFVYTQALKEKYIDNLFNQVKGFGYVAFETKWEGLPYIELGDLLNIDGKESIVLRYNLKSPQGLNSTLSAPSIIDSVIDYVDNSNSIENRQKRTEIIVDKQNQNIESVVSQTKEQNEQIAKVTQTVEELNSKISDIADITISAEDTDAQVELDNINQSEPIRIVVRPTGEDISYLYPRDNLFPSDDLYLKNRIIRFENKTTGKIFDYELPDDLLYYGGNYYDEFILDYDGQSCVVNKNVAYNPDGTKYLLRRTETINYEFPTISLTDGDYVVSLPGYSNAYLFVRLMAQNIYTTQFATRAELNSEISQTARDITLRVSETYATKETTNSLSTRIKQTAKTIDLTATDNKTSAGITIKLKNEDGTQIDSKTANITMSGLVKFTDLSGKGTTEINGANILTGTITANQIASNTITASKVASDIITTNNFSAQKINANNITSGTISTKVLSSDVITTSNFSAQKINADNITSGTISGQTISGGVISGSKITSTSGNIGGFDIDGSSGLAGSYGTIRPNGNLLLYPNYGSARYVLSDKITFNAQGGVVIASNSNANVSVYNTNLDLKACAGAIAYLGCMGNTDGTDERSAVECGDRTLYLRSDGVIYANGAAIGGSSSKNTKTNIVELSQEKKDELYKLIKDIPLCEYDYKPQYGKENNYGFLIEDIEETKLNDLLHITKINEDIKTYCSEDLTRLNLIMIKELMNKVETLENRIKELESDK